MSTSDDFAGLERRVRELEDRLAILQLVATYGPSVDGGAVKESGRIWTEDCVYDSDAENAGSEGVRGREGIEGVARMCRDLDFGVAHITHLPIVTVDGDRATVVGHSNTFHQERGGDASGYVVGRVSSNRWDLERVEGSWQVRRRTNRLLDGSTGSKDLFVEGVREVQEADGVG